jgi:hypothetical protein
MPSQSKSPISPCQVSAAALVAGLGLYMAAFRRDMDLIAFAVALIVLAAMVYLTNRIVDEIRSVNRPADVAYDEGYEAGYDRGWREGHAEASPTVVRLVSDSEGGHAEIG